MLSYTLTCTSSVGSAAQTATLTVNPAAGMDSAAMAAAHNALRSSPHASTGYLVTPVVADVYGTRALATDMPLIEPWGLVLIDAATMVVNRRAATAHSYDGSGQVRSQAVPPVRFPAGFGATGAVANPGGGFVVSSAELSGVARLVFAGASGRIAAWVPGVDPGRALVTYTAADGAVYTGLGILVSGGEGGSLLYAADFHNARIDVFDAHFTRQAASPAKFSFADPQLPSGYAPFGVDVIGQEVYVSFALPAATSGADAMSGAGLGLVDVFTPEGAFLRRLATGGALNAPWRVLRARDAGGEELHDTLLVGNTGDGRINAFDASSGALLGSLTDPGGAPLEIPAMHGLAFGNGYAGQPETTLFFTAGSHDGALGWYGRIDPAAAPRPRSEQGALSLSSRTP